MASSIFKLLNSTRKPGRLYKLASADGAVGFGMDSVSVPAVDESRMCATAIISTPTPDRVRDVMVPRGIDLTHYRLNPVVLWEHGLAGITTPIAKSEHPDGRLAIDVFDDRVEGTAYHTNKNQESANIFALLAERIVRASSIRAGDDAKTHMQRTDDGVVIVVDWWPLIEWSWGMVGVNPETVTKVLDRGRIGEHALAPSIRKSLIPFAAQPRRNQLHVTGRMKNLMRGKTMDPTELEQIKARIAELSPEEIAAELAAAKEAEDAELVALLEAAGKGGKTAPPEEEPEEEEDELSDAPPSARYLSMMHGKLAALVSEAEALTNTYENPEVIELNKTFLDSVKSHMADMAVAFGAVSGGKALECEGGKCDDKDEDEMELVKTWIAEGGARPLTAQGYVARLQAIARQKTLSLCDQATLAGIATQLQRAVTERRKTLAKNSAPPTVSLAADIEEARKLRQSLKSIGAVTH